ncbi:class I SAM-dependent methyltransferase [Streptomyces sp. NPDC018031]|uniref:class I SAM-dependent methyltransferase n=1 Tax=Streptomyces sp. NPDC018031 TaxID=3365033 RepID=UPI0037A58522
MTAPTTPAAQRPRSLDDVKGWFPPLDQVLFERFLARQERLDERGDLLEMGAYLGKSAIFTASFRRPEERFTVCDLFDADAPDEHNAAEARKSYATLTRVAFEQNYRAFHDELPYIVQGPTSEVPAHVRPDSCRFVHVDASHLYEHVAGDIVAARAVLLPHGVVALDDFRSEHTPGVAAATWEAVFNGGLRPICLSTQKLYGTWGDPEPFQEELLATTEWRAGLRMSVQEVGGQRILRFSGRPEHPATAPVSRFAGEAPAEPAAAPAAAPRPAPRPAPVRAGRRVARELLPPIVTRALRKRRAERARTR